MKRKLEAYAVDEMYPWDELKSMIRASDEELKATLRLLNSGVDTHGNCTIVDDSKTHQIIDYIILQARNSRSFCGDLVQSLEDTWGFCPDVAHRCLELHDSTMDEVDREYSDPKHLHVEYARQILQGRGYKMEICEFVYQLRQLMPVNLDLLDGEILVEKDGDQVWVFLPSDHNTPNANTLTSVSQAFPSDPQNPNRFYKLLMESSLSLDSLGDDDVTFFLAGTMEQKLEALLLENPYTHYEEKEGVEINYDLYQWKDLKRMLDATDEQLKSALTLVSAVEINGYWRIVDDLSIDLVLCHLVLEADSEEDSSFSSFDGDKVVKSLADTWGFSPVLARHCLERYASTTDERLWELDTKRVCVEIARGLLKTRGAMEIQDFMDQWSCVGLPVSLDMLEGEILVQIDNRDKAWVHLASVSQAFPPDHQNLSRFYKPRMKKTESRYNPFVFEKVEILPPDCSNQRDEDGGTMEQKLKALLLQNPYTLDEENEGGQKRSGLYKWDDLKSMFHAADEELKSALRLVSAIEINGYWRLVDDMCIDQVLYNLVWKADCEDWSFSSLDGSKVIKCLGDTWGLSPVLARHCLELYARTTDGRVWELDTKRVCVELARWVIKSNGKTRMKIEEFMRQWSCVGLPVSLDMLEGEILVEEHGNHSWVYLPLLHPPGFIYL
ncbi:hypothetical protein R6Q57_020305 [Mikania cordata]